MEYIFSIFSKWTYYLTFTLSEGIRESISVWVISEQIFSSDSRKESAAESALLSKSKFFISNKFFFHNLRNKTYSFQKSRHKPRSTRLTDISKITQIIQIYIVPENWNLNRSISFILLNRLFFVAQNFYYVTDSKKKKWFFADNILESRTLTPFIVLKPFWPY